VPAKPENTATPETPAADNAASNGDISETVTADASVIGTPPEAAKEKPTEPKAAPKPARKAPNPLQLYVPREEDKDGNTVELENNEFWFMPFRQKTNKRNQSRDNQNGGYKGKRKGGPKTGGGYKKGARPDARPPKAKEPARPEDSPFAALLALKNKKD